MSKDIDKIKLLIMRIILFAMGAVLGWLAMHQFLTAFPDAVRDNLKIVFIVVSALILGTALMLSAKAFILFLGWLAGVLSSLFASKKPVELVGYVLGILLGLMITFLCFMLLNQFVPIFAVVVAASIAILFLSCYIAAVSCAKWLSSKSQQEEDEDVIYRGYILDKSVFYGNALRLLVTEWAPAAEVLVSARVMDALIAEMDTTEEAKTAVALYQALTAEKLIRVVQPGKNGETDCKKETARLAELRRLKVIVKADADSVGYSEHLKVFALSSLAE